MYVSLSLCVALLCFFSVCFASSLCLSRSSLSPSVSLVHAHLFRFHEFSFFPLHVSPLTSLNRCSEAMPFSHTDETVDEFELIHSSHKLTHFLKLRSLSLLFFCHSLSHSPAQGPDVSSSKAILCGARKETAVSESRAGTVLCIISMLHHSSCLWLTSF